MTFNSDSTFIELVNDYHQQPDKFVFFIGAGLSQPLFPSWSKLLYAFIAEAKKNGSQFDDEELSNYVKNGQNYLDIAEFCVGAMGDHRYRDLMEFIFDKDFSDEDIPESYKALMDLSPKTIITTNYDRIPDRAGNGKYRIHTNKNASEASRNFANEKNIVFKIHGDITEQSSIVLKTTDYQKIINNNESTRNLLNSLLSTKKLIFVGFSLSDPHIEVILEKIKIINDGIPLSHYILLNEKSTFKISSFEKKYGVKIIPYEPSNINHPEVTEFLRSLDNSISKVTAPPKSQEKLNVEGAEQLVIHLESSISETLIDTEYTIYCNDNDLYISFTPAGETKSEIQKEILSVIKVMSFECNFIKKVIICVATRTKPLVNCDDSQRLLIKAAISFSDANKYSTKQISTSTVWKLIEFYIPPSLSNIFENKESTEFPLSLGIIGEH
ncbi:SIR2 family protein [Aeromonas veronii]|uniref:SIR2 family protein n=1 Tax=Aeromonas veronii TaxID=654 RepID=UPI0034173113